MEAIWANADESDPVHSPDPIAFIYIFGIVLERLVPWDVVRRHADEIYEVMGELVGIIEEEDGSSWLHSRKICLTLTCLHFYRSALADTKLKPTLTMLVRIWDPRWQF